MVLDEEASFILNGLIKDIVKSIPDSLSTMNESNVRNRLTPNNFNDFMLGFVYGRIYDSYSIYMWKHTNVQLSETQHHEMLDVSLRYSDDIKREIERAIAK
jgi:hypothetical protein